MCWFLNVDLPELAEEHEIMKRDSFSDFLDFLLSDLAYDVRSSREDVNPHDDVGILEDVASAVALCKRIRNPEAHCHLLCSTLHFDQWYEILSKT